MVEIGATSRPIAEARGERRLDTWLLIEHLLTMEAEDARSCQAATHLALARRSAPADATRRNHGG